MIVLMVYILLLLLLGLSIGSFVNAWVWRLRHNQSVVSGRSKCPHCNHKLAVKDLIPLISFVALKGKCRYCKKPISWQYPIVELGTGLLFALIAWHFQPLNQANVISIVLWCIVTVFLVAAFVYDLKYMQLPDRFMLPAICIALILLLINALNNGLSQVLTQIIATAVFAGFYLLLWLLSKGRFLGGGDVRLAVAMGLLLAVPQLLIAVFVAYLAGATVGIVLIASKNKKRTSKIALAPFLIGGLYFGLFFGNQIAVWYLSFFKL